MNEDKEYSYLVEDYDEEIDWKTLFGGAAVTFLIAWLILMASPPAPVC